MNEDSTQVIGGFSFSGSPDNPLLDKMWTIIELFLPGSVSPDLLLPSLAFFSGCILTTALQSPWNSLSELDFEIPKDEFHFWDGYRDGFVYESCNQLILSCK